MGVRISTQLNKVNFVSIFFVQHIFQLFSHLQLECMDSLRGQLEKANARLDDLQAQVLPMLPKYKF